VCLNPPAGGHDRKKELNSFMTDVLKMGKKVLTIGVVATTILWSVGVAAFVAPLIAKADTTVTLTAGDVIQGASTKNVFYYAADGKRYTFPTQDVAFSWLKDWTTVKTISDAQLGGITIGGTVAYRPGTQLVKIQTDPKVYAVEANGSLRWIETASIAQALWGTNWGARLRDVDPSIFPYVYKISAASVNTTTYPVGSLVKMGADYYYINAAASKQKVTAEGLTANGFQTKFAATATDLSAYTTGADLVAKDANLTTVAGTTVVGGTTPVTPVTAGSLTVALASDTPASGSLIVSDTASDSSDSSGRTPMARFNFTASADGAVKVKTIKMKQIGVSANNDIATLYIYDGDTFIAQHSALSEKVFTFNASAGLFTVPAGTTKTITVRADMSDNLNSGPTIGMQIAAAADVVIDGTGTVGMSAPLSGNLFTYIAVSDNGYAQITNIAPSGDNTVNPGTNNFSVWSLQIQGGDQILKLNRVKFSEAGSVAKADLANFKLYEGGVQIGSAIASMADDLTVEFKDLNFTIGKGLAKTLELRADVVSGSSRTFRFMVQNIYDIDILDTSYGNLVQPDNATEATWAVRYQGNASTYETTINAGTLTVSLNSTTPTGNIAQGATQVEIAKYDFKAVGEDVKVTDVYFKTDSTGNEVGLDNVAMFVDGSQIGVTADLAADNTAVQWTFGSSFIIPATQTKTLVIKADVKNAASTNLTAGSVVTPTLNSTAGNATTQTSLTAISLASSLDASALTVSSGALSVAQNNSLPDGTSANPNGITNEADVKIASYKITAGAAEGVTVNQLVIKDDGAGTYQLGDVFYNLVAKINGVQVGETQANLDSAGEDGSYTLTVSPSVEITAGQSATVDIYASVLSGQSITTAEAVLDLDSVTYYKKVSQTSATYDTDQVNQAVYIAANGTLSVTLASDNPASQIVTMGMASTDRVGLGKFSLTATTEDVKLESLIIFDQMTVQGATSAQATSTMTNFGLYTDGATAPLNSLEVNLTATATPNTNSGYAVFNLNPVLVIPKGTTVNLTVKAQPNTYLNSSAGVTHALRLENAAQSLNSQTRSILARGAKSNVAINVPSTDVTANTMVLYRTKPSITSAAASTKLSSGSTVTLANFNVTASPTQASLKKLTFNVSISDTTTTTGILTLDDFAFYKDDVLLNPASEVYIFDGSSTAAARELDTTGTGCMTTDSFDLGCAATNVPVTGTGTVIVVFATEVKVPVSGANFKLKARVQNVSGVSTDGDAVTTELVNDDSLASGGTAVTTNYNMYYLDALPGAFYGGTAGGYGIGLNSAAAGAGTAYEGNFIWSDESQGSSHAYATLSGAAGSVATAYASSETQEWTAGYRVGSLNTGISWTAQK